MTPSYCLQRKNEVKQDFSGIFHTVSTFFLLEDAFSFFFYVSKHNVTKQQLNITMVKVPRVKTAHENSTEHARLSTQLFCFHTV